MRAPKRRESAVYGAFAAGTRGEVVEGMDNAEYMDGHRAGHGEAATDRWTLEAFREYAAFCPARDDWERGFLDGARLAASQHEIAMGRTLEAKRKVGAAWHRAHGFID